MSNSVIRSVTGLTITTGSTRLVGPLDLTLPSGEILGIVGESGSGKTLTLRALGGIVPAGLTATETPAWRSAMVFQDPGSYFNPRWKISRSLYEVLNFSRGVAAVDIPRRVVELLKQVELRREDGDLYPHEMSGGMLQRASIAMALSTEPDVLLIDEATSALDPVTEMRILDLLCAVTREHLCSTVVVSHNLTSLARQVDRIAVMYRGHIVEEGDATAVLSAPRHRYLSLLQQAIPSAATAGTRLAEIPQPGTTTFVPQPDNGCPFAMRCPFADDQCNDPPPWAGDSVHRYRCVHPVLENES